jgi:hypothetical protein
MLKNCICIIFVGPKFRDILKKNLTKTFSVVSTLSFNRDKVKKPSFSIGQKNHLAVSEKLGLQAFLRVLKYQNNSKITSLISEYLFQNFCLHKRILVSKIIFKSPRS